MTDANIAIQARQLSKRFGQRSVLRAIDLEVVAGESVVLTGANGAGKTTLLGCLASIVRPTAGEVRWFGRPSAGQTDARRMLGMATHETRLYPNLSLRENLVFVARMYDVPKPQSRADELLESVGFGPHAHRMPPVLSQGMRQRLAVLRALVHDPPILLLDEPFSGLDAAGRQWLLGLTAQWRARGKTLCLVLHDQEEAVRLGDRVLELHNGRLLGITPGHSADCGDGGNLARSMTGA